MTTFVALDFETADYEPASACAVGIVRVENNRIVKRAYSLIRPPRRSFLFTCIHGITWRDVARQPSFGELWPSVGGLFGGTNFIAAHNAPFDRGVLYACCDAHGVRHPKQGFVCTVRLARNIWDIYPTNLPRVCEHLSIGLDHHNALSDAEACARIVMAALNEGRRATSKPAFLRKFSQAVLKPKD